MKITTTITQTIEKSHGQTVVLSRTRVTEHGDNPAFERREAATAVREAKDEYIERQALDGTRPT